jgi:hypothetical protein
VSFGSPPSLNSIKDNQAGLDLEISAAKVLEHGDLSDYFLNADSRCNLAKKC